MVRLTIRLSGDREESLLNACRNAVVRDRRGLMMRAKKRRDKRVFTQIDSPPCCVSEPEWCEDI